MSTLTPDIHIIRHVYCHCNMPVSDPACSCHGDKCLSHFVTLDIEAQLRARFKGQHEHHFVHAPTKFKERKLYIPVHVIINYRSKCQIYAFEYLYSNLQPHPKVSQSSSTSVCNIQKLGWAWGRGQKCMQRPFCSCDNYMYLQYCNIKTVDLIAST